MQAEKIVKDPGKFRKFIAKAVRFIRKAERIPVLCEVVDDCATMIELLCDWFSGCYRKLPISSIISIVGALLYLLSPIDLVPDHIPVIGYLDDLSVLSTILKLGLASDLEKYRDWKRDCEKKIHRARLHNEIDRFQCVVGESILVAAFLTDDSSLKILCASEDLREYPLNCRAELLSLPEWSNEKTAAELIEFYNDVISDHCFIRSSLGRIEFVRERDYNGNSDDFTIVE